MHGLRLCGIALASLGVAWAQVPNAALRFDLLPSYLSESGGKNKLRWYDAMGRASTVGVGLNLEPGYYVLVTERLQKISGDRDHEQLDEFYIEEPGLWRVGRQYIPFGHQNLVRQASIAAKTNQLPFIKKRFPIQLAYVNDEGKLANGVVGRIGTKLVGISLAFGNHFLLSSTNLAAFGNVDSKPVGRKGYQFMGGLDLTRTWGPVDVSAEYLALRRGESLQDPNSDMTDLTLSVKPDPKRKFLFGWAHEYRTDVDSYRVESEIQMSRNVALRSFVRFDRGEWKELSVGFRIRF